MEATLPGSIALSEESLHIMEGGEGGKFLKADKRHRDKMFRTENSIQ